MGSLHTHMQTHTHLTAATGAVHVGHSTTLRLVRMRRTTPAATTPAAAAAAVAAPELIAHSESEREREREDEGVEMLSLSLSFVVDYTHTHTHAHTRTHTQSLTRALPLRIRIFSQKTAYASAPVFTVLLFSFFCCVLSLPFPSLVAV